MVGVKAPITQEFLKEHFDYSDGHLWWIKDTSKYGPSRVGKRFGAYNNNGYIVGKIKGKHYVKHHIIWNYHNGYLPTKQLDHINGVRDDNRIENLREVTNQQNSFNRVGWSKKTSSKFKGVSWHKASGKWQAKCNINRKQYHLGLHQTEEEAAKAYDDFSEKYHKEFARKNL